VPRPAGRGLLAAVLAAALAVSASAASAAPLRPGRESDATALAWAFTAAWNAQDLDAVLACFAPDAVVRERRGDVPAHVWDVRDPQVVRAYLDDAPESRNYDACALVWVTGRRQIAAWAAARFARRDRFVAGPYRPTGDTVNWSYQAIDDLAQRLLGVGPLEGDAEAVVRGGRITVLTLVVSPEAVQRQQGEEAAVLALAATRRATPEPAAPGVPPRRPPRDSAAAPTGVAWPLALAGLALLGAATVTLHRRRRP
jgi:ketosteroid isomerase-like protein